MNRNESSFMGHLFCVFTLALILCSTTAFGATIHVPSDHPTIQTAIDAAADGDTVLVADGTYKGKDNKNLDFNGKELTLQSENGPLKTIIDCENDGRGFYFHNGELEDALVSGFTITNGRVEDQGGGIYVINSAPTITNCIIVNNMVTSNSNNSNRTNRGRTTSRINRTSRDNRTSRINRTSRDNRTSRTSRTSRDSRTNRDSRMKPVSRVLSSSSQLPGTRVIPVNRVNNRMKPKGNSNQQTMQQRQKSNSQHNRVARTKQNRIISRLQQRRPIRSTVKRNRLQNNGCGVSRMTPVVCCVASFCTSIASRRMALPLMVNRHGKYNENRDRTYAALLR